MKHKRKVKKKVKILVVLILLLVSLLVGLYFYLQYNKTEPGEKPKVVNEIKEYGYVLE